MSRFFVFWTCVMLIIGGCGYQNASYLTQTSRVADISFARIKNSTILYRGIDREHLVSGGEHVELITQFSLDSLNRLCFNEFRSQLTKRFPSMYVIDASHQDLPSDTNIQLRVTRFQIADNLWLVGASGAPKAYCILEIDMFDARKESSLFTLQSNAKIVELAYANPWQKATQTMVAKIVDYIDSNGEDYEKP